MVPRDLQLFFRKTKIVKQVGDENTWHNGGMVGGWEFACVPSCLCFRGPISNITRVSGLCIYYHFQFPQMCIDMSIPDIFALENKYCIPSQCFSVCFGNLNEWLLHWISLRWLSITLSLSLFLIGRGVVVYFVSLNMCFFFKDNFSMFVCESIISASIYLPRTSD